MMEVLMDWITTEGNYSECCGCTGNKGKSKSQFHKELSLLIKAKKGAERTDKQVENKITSIERQFKAATDWLANTGAGLDNPGDIRSHVLKLCPVCCDVEEVMKDRHNARPLSTNEEDPNVDFSTTFDYDNESADENENEEAPAPTQPPVVATTGTAAASATATTATTAAATPSSSITTSVGSKGRKRKPEENRLTASSNARKKKKEAKEVDDCIRTHMSGGLSGDVTEDSQLASISVRNVAAKEKEAAARMLEAQAISNKANQEAEKARLESSILEIEKTSKLLLTRKQMLDAGYCRAINE